jgi:type IV secretory pathway TrbL component
MDDLISKVYDIVQEFIDGKLGEFVSNPAGIISVIIAIIITILALRFAAKQVTNFITGTIGKLWPLVGGGVILFIIYLITK